ncbi:MAG: FtsX-like permease family protein [Lewinellaceae bacterium]|nr:FtsX-like permease family protein [Lewinellaceae bacterium]
MLSGFRPAESLKGMGTGQKAGGFSLRRLLVGTQFAISQMLIIGAVTVTAQMEYTRKADLGFQREGIVTVPIPGRYDAAKQNTLRQQLGSLVGVESITLCSQPPASDNNWGTRIRLEGRPDNENWDVNLKSQDDRYLETFGLKLVAGRNLERSDTVRELLVNEELMSKLGLASPEEVLGKKVFDGKRGFPVVGVVKNFHNRSFHEPIHAQVLMSDAGDFDNCALRLHMQTQKTALAAVEKIWSGLFPDYFFEYEFMDTRLAKFYEQESIVLQLMRLFAGIAVFVGCLGLYGMAAFMVARKRKEIGIRKTLGATVAGVLWLFGKEYTRLLLVAFVLSMPLAWWAMNRWLDNYTFRISLGAAFSVVIAADVCGGSPDGGFSIGKSGFGEPGEVIA